MNIEMTVKKVSLYRTGCTAVCEGSVQLPAGTSRCRITGLPPGTDAQSVRIRTSSGLTASGVQVMYPDADEQKEETREIDEKIALCDAKLSACETQAELWRKNISFSHKEGTDLEMMNAYAELLPQKLEECACRKAELSREKDSLLKEREEIEKKISRPYVSVIMNCLQAGTYTVQTEYHDYSASWNPVYEIRTDGEEEKLTLRLRAAMRQTTGIDWKDVQVSLLTGSPSASHDLPVLPEMHLKFREEIRFKGTAAPRMLMSNMAMASADAMAMPAAEETVGMNFHEAKEESAEANEGETMTEYVLSGIWNILSDGNDVMSDLNTKEIPCSYHVISVPKKDSSAYLAAEIRTADIEDILNSRASVYLKDTYAGDIYVNADLTKETYDLSLGRDETIVIRREQKKKYTSNVLLKGQTKTEYVYEITVLSNKKKDCRVTVLDQIPVSDEKTIIVEKGEISGRLNEESGEVRWDIDLKPQDRKVLKLGYSVSWPKEKKIQETVKSAGTRFCPVCGAKVFGRFCPECGNEVN